MNDQSGDIVQPAALERRSGRARLIVGYLAIAAILPYFTVKLAWIAGSSIGIVSTSPVDPAVVRGGNIITVLMEIVAVFIILVFTHSWGLRTPAWLVLAPTWVATGLLAPFVITGPVVAGSVASGSVAAGDGSLAPWVGPLVYLGFGAQAIGIVTSFVLYALTRWPRVLRSRLAYHPVGLYQPASILLTWIACVLLAVVAVTRMCWAVGVGSAALAEHRNLAERLTDASTAAFAVAAAVGLIALIYRRPKRLLTWFPLALGWIGSGVVFGSGVYAMVLLLINVAGFGPVATSPGLVPLVDFTQALVGTLLGTVGVYLLLELNTVTTEPRGRTR